MLALGLAAIFLVCATGLVLDQIADWTGQRAGVTEIQDYATMSSAEFADKKDAIAEARPNVVADLRVKMAYEKRNLAGFLSGLNDTEAAGGHFATAFASAITTQNEQADKESGKAWEGPNRPEVMKAADEDWAEVLSEARSTFTGVADRIDGLIDTADENARKAIDNDGNMDKDKKDEALDNVSRDRLIALRGLTETKTDFDQTVKSIRGRKIFDSLVEYEGRHLKAAISALLTGNISTGLSDYLDAKKGGGVPAAAEATADGPGEKPGFIIEVMMLIAGIQWLFSQYWLYGVLLVLAALAIWALFGGAMHRVAALQAAREEKISPAEAIRFARSRFLSFFAAPLMPLAFVVALGVLIMGGGLLTNIPVIGPFIVGLLFIFAILLGLLIAFLLIGLLAGAGLMYPTIAVEGSDCFDGMSRSFTYIFSRPWRTVLYASAALVHGTLCYVFVRFFAFLALSATHCFCKAAVWTGGETLPGVADPDKIDVLWAAPTFQNLHTWNLEAMTTPQSIGALLVMAWVYLIVALVAAFALSYFTSSMTMIYYLLRREVDATDVDEVYVGEEEDDFLPPTEIAAEPAEDAEAPAEEEAPAQDTPADAEAPADDAPTDDDADADDADETAPEDEGEETKDAE